MKAVVDRIVQYANRYKLTDVSTGVVLGTFDFDEVTGTVQQVGTEIDKELFDSIADDLATRLVANGGDSKAVVVTFSEATALANVVSGETHATLFGKLKKWFTDRISKLKAFAYDSSVKVTSGDIDSTIASTANLTSGAITVKNATNAVNATNATNDKNGKDITTYVAVETDPTVPSWAKNSTKPSYTKAEVGLGNVDNTSDANKPISTATQAALDNKVDKVSGKQLSTNDYTSSEKTKLAGLATDTVRYGSQSLTDAQKSQARTNIGAGTSSFDGTWSSLSGKPTIPTVNDGVLTVQKNGAKIATFSANQSGNVTANVTVPTKVSELTNDSGYLTSAGITGKTDTSVLPNNSGEIKTKFRCSQKGHTSGATWYYKLCTLPVNNSGNYASAIITGRIGGWVSGNMSFVQALIWNRDTPGIALIDVAGSASAMSSVWNIGDLVLYVNSDATASVYVKCLNYFTFDLDIELYQGSATITYDGTYATSVSGTLTAQASTSTKRVEVVNGQLLINGNAVALSSAIPTKTSQLTNDSGYLTSHQSLANYVDKTTAQTISGKKTFDGAHAFTGETTFTNASYAPTFTDIATSIGKSSMFTRSAHMQMIAGQIIAPNAAVSNTTYAYNTEVGKIKFQTITGISNGQPTLSDIAVLSSDGMTVNGATVLTDDGLFVKNQGTGTYSLGIGPAGRTITASGTSSIAIGDEAIASSRASIAIGDEATGAGVNTVAIGTFATVEGTQGVALGYNASVPDNYSIALGPYTSGGGTYSVALGYNAESNANYGIAIGRNANVKAANGIAIGYKTTVNYAGSILIINGSSTSSAPSTAAITYLGANYSSTGRSLLLGVAGTGYTYMNSAGSSWTSASDIRDKTDIEEINHALDFIEKLKPITYVMNERERYLIRKIDEETGEEGEPLLDANGKQQYDVEAHARGDKKKHRRFAGLSAQDTYQAMLDCYNGDTNYAQIVDNNKFDHPDDEYLEQYSMSYERLVPFLIKAMQEQQAQIDELKERITNLEIDES